MNLEQIIREKMAAAGQSAASTESFLANHRKLVAGESGLIAESTITPVEELTSLDSLSHEPGSETAALLAQTVVIKLNGGLGTSMGLDRAKSLLEVKEGLTFLDLIARQTLHLRDANGTGPRFLLMNSFSTSADTLEFLKRYPSLGSADTLEFMQSMTPKIDTETFAPTEWAGAPEMEWCPPGHGDIYTSLLGSGRLKSLVDQGIKFAFISNSDNLGATPDPAILRYVAKNDFSFLMEVTRRTPSDSKGGHLAWRISDGHLLLRESAQCPSEDEAQFQDISRHRFFNTNNLWVRLDRLQEKLAKLGGVLPLPLIINRKTVNPKESSSPAVFQLETAMGAAIELFDQAAALEVPRSRFAPVKKTSDLMVLRSDACEIRPDWTLGLVGVRHGIPPSVELDKAYKLVGDYERMIPEAPSLAGCQNLEIKGCVTVAPGVTIQGNVRVTGPGILAAGTYRDTNIVLQ